MLDSRFKEKKGHFYAPFFINLKILRMNCQKIKQKLNLAKLENYSSIIVEENEINQTQLAEIIDCGYVVVKKQNEEGFYYLISEI